MKNKAPDYILLAVTGMIIFFGLFALASAASVGSEIRFFRQILVGFLPGLGIAFLLYKTPLSLLKKWSPYFLLFNIFLILLVFLPFLSETRGGATRWLDLGFVSFQPTELLKLTFVLYISHWIITKTQGKKKNTSQSFQEILLPFLIISGTIAVLLRMQPDLSTLLIILISGFTIYFVAKTPLWHTIVLLLSGSLGVALTIFLTPYQLTRILNAFNPDIDPLGATYQLRQALITVGSGGIFGLGVGMSQQKFGFLPEAATDSIFAILAEETGFIGSILLVSLFFLFFWRGFLIAKNNKDGFARLITIGICSWIFIQTSINIGVMVGLLPVTGIPLPFISYGSSHLIAELAAVGVLLNTSKYVRK